MPSRLSTGHPKHRGRLPILPHPYPSELAYSIVARALSSWGYLDHRGMLEQILGGALPNVRHPISAPGLCILAQLTYPQDEDAGAVFVARHTLLPYYLATERLSVRQKWWTQISTDPMASAAKLQQLTVRRALVPPFLRYCRTCAALDQRQYGEPYWHVGHQLAGVSRCLMHAEPLFDTSVAFKADKALSFISLRDQLEEFGQGTASAALFPEPIERTLLHLHRRFHQVREAYARESLVARNRLALTDLGYRTATHGLDMARVSRDLKDWLLRAGSSAHVLGTHDWWLPILRLIGGSTLLLDQLVFEAFLASRGMTAPIQADLFVHTKMPW